jgi:hypothetical protein
MAQGTGQAKCDHAGRCALSQAAALRADARDSHASWITSASSVRVSSPWPRLEGYVWGVRWQNTYPGMKLDTKLVEESPDSGSEESVRQAVLIQPPLG